MVKDHLEKLSSALWQLQQSGAFCDTALVVSGDAELEAHAVVLAAASVQLRSMLRQNQLDDTDNQRTCRYQLDIIDYDMSTVKALLELIYTGEMSASSSANFTDRIVLTGLCSKLGITVDDNSADNASDMELPK